MSTARTFSLTGALLAESTHGGRARSTTMMLDSSAQYPQSFDGVQDVSGTVGTPYDLELGGITSVYLFALRVLSNGPLTLLLDSAAGTAQEIPVSEEILLSNKGGVPFTRIQIVGTADIEFMIAGT